MVYFWWESRPSKNITYDIDQTNISVGCWGTIILKVQFWIRAIQFIMSDQIAHKQCILMRELERVICERWGDGFTWSPYLMRGHILKHTIRGLQFMKSCSPTDICSILEREHKRVIYGSHIRIVWHSHPTPQQGCKHRHTIRALKIMVSGFPTYMWCINVRKQETVIYGSSGGWLQMAILLYEEVQTQTHN
jgi:hypothetical protein